MALPTFPGPFEAELLADLPYDPEVLLFDELLSIEENPVPDDGPDPGPTYFYSSPRWPSS